MPMKNTTPLTMVGKEEPTVDPLDLKKSSIDGKRYLDYL
jgi:hypothetical protein